MRACCSTMCPLNFYQSDQNAKCDMKIFRYMVQSNLLSKYLEGPTKLSVLLIRGTYYQYWLT